MSALSMLKILEDESPIYRELAIQVENCSELTNLPAVFSALEKPILNEVLQKNVDVSETFEGRCITTVYSLEITQRNVRVSLLFSKIMNLSHHSVVRGAYSVDVEYKTQHEYLLQDGIRTITNKDQSQFTVCYPTIHSSGEPDEHSNEILKQLGKAVTHLTKNPKNPLRYLGMTFRLHQAKRANNAWIRFAKSRV